MIKRKTLVVGVTGGIGSGKSDVCKIFELLGARIFYSDLIARELIDSQVEIKNLIKKAFGKNSYLPNGKLDRQYISKLIFQDSALQKKLNDIVHPPIIELLERKIQQEKRLGKYPFIAVEAALIYEARIENMFDFVVVVDAEENVRVERLMRRDNCSHDEILRRFSAQLSQKDKTTKADFVIENSGTYKSLDNKCKFLFNVLVQLS